MKGKKKRFIHSQAVKISARFLNVFGEKNLGKALSTNDAMPGMAMHSSASKCLLIEKKSLGSILEYDFFCLFTFD